MAHAIDPRDPDEDKFELFALCAVIGTLIYAVIKYQPMY